MSEKVSENPIFIEIAGYKIKISFGTADFSYLKETFKGEFYKYYSGFINNNSNLNTSFEIMLAEKPLLETTGNIKSGQRYIMYFQYTGSKTIKTYYSISIFQFQIILKYVLLKLLKNTGFILHASGCICNNKAYIFTGKQNSGKSTIIKILRNTFSIFADDSLIIKKEATDYFCYQTPFLEKEFWIKRQINKYPISIIFFLCKNEIPLIQRINNKQKILKLLTKQILIPDNESRMNQLKLVLKFVNKSNNFLYLNHFDKHDNLAEYISKNKAY